jgi:hypothetical protein
VLTAWKEGVCGPRRYVRFSSAAPMNPPKSEGEPVYGSPSAPLVALTRKGPLIRDRKSAGQPAELALPEEGLPPPDLSPL